MPLQDIAYQDCTYRPDSTPLISAFAATRFMYALLVGRRSYRSSQAPSPSGRHGAGVLQAFTPAAQSPGSRSSTAARDGRRQLLTRFAGKRAADGEEAAVARILSLREVVNVRDQLVSGLKRASIIYQGAVDAMVRAFNMYGTDSCVQPVRWARVAARWSASTSARPIIAQPTSGRTSVPISDSTVAILCSLRVLHFVPMANFPPV